MNKQNIPLVGFIMSIVSFTLALFQALQTTPDAVVIRVAFLGNVLILLALVFVLTKEKSKE